MMREAKREWKFCVCAKTLPGESVFVVGNCGELGSWSNKGALRLNKDDEERDDEGNYFWSGICKIPCERDVLYRYFVGVVIDCDDQSQATHIVVRRWETNVIPRTVRKGVLSNVNTVLEPHTFGMYDGVRMVDRGWLTSETAVQFKLFNNPIQLWKRKYEGRKVFVKLTPIQLRQRKVSEIPSDVMDESLDTQDPPEQQERWPITEISVMNNEEWEFKLQDQFGRVYNPDDCIIFQVSLHHPETVAYMVDYYVYSLRAGDGEPPYHIGFSYILPGMLIASEGRAIVPITSNSHRPIGQLAVDYVVVQPINGFECDMSISYSRVWKKSWQGLDVGHRGLGTSFKPTLAECADVRENTIASLKTAASAGADLVEFDVQLSKDLIPVLYHDFHVCIAMKRKKQLADHDMLEMPVKDLTLEQLQQLKVYHLEEGKDKNQRFFDEELEEHQPFPTLCQALESLDPHVGFNIEIKWTMQLKDGSYELNHPFDLNMYLDTVLKVVLEHSGTRKIVFSCFHPDICTMLRLKQNRFPVVFLTQGVTSKYPAYRDPRTQTIPMAVNFACGAGILGINAHTEDILRDKQQVRLVLDAGLVIFCWGDDNNDPATIKLLKQLGIHGVIYDKIDQYSSKEVKESIFLAEAREMQKQLLKTAEEVSAPSQPPQSPIPPPPPRETFEVDDVEAVRKTLASASTGSLLASWPISKEGSDITIVEGEAKAS